MLFSKYIILTAASLALRAHALPTAPNSNAADLAKREAVPSPEIVETEATKRSFHGIPYPPLQEKDASVVEDTSVVQLNHPSKRVAEGEEQDPVPVAGSDYSKKSSITPAVEEIEKRATTMDPNVGIVQELPSGIIIMGIAFTFYAGITAISMKDTEY